MLPSMNARNRSSKSRCIGELAAKAPLGFAQLPDLEHSIFDRQRGPEPRVVPVVRREGWIHAHLHPFAAGRSRVHRSIIVG